MAQDVGAHRRIRSTHGDPLESEIYKRAFWLLFSMDTIMSSLMGRPRSTAIDDLDIDMPMALGDYEEEPNVVAYGTLLLKLMEIWGRVQRTIYPIKRKEQSQSYQEIVADLDSALNQWVDSVPAELRWDPHREDRIALNQSTCLYATYYHLQLLIHRPFIPSPGNHDTLSSTTFPSLAICANAARSCAHVLDIQSKGGPPLYNPQMISALFDSAVVLLLNVFHRSRLSTDFSVQKCLNVLRLYERRWQIAGRNADIISEMIDDGLPSSLPSLKRTRDNGEAILSSSKAISDVGDEPRNIAGSNRVAAATHAIQQLQVSSEEIEQFFLPLHTEELGRLPVYDSFDFDFIFNPDAFPANVESEPSVPIPEVPFSGNQFARSLQDVASYLDPNLAVENGFVHADGHLETGIFSWLLC
ncbi:hypothetical protein B0H10DRAFT_1319252 [Mycena sp. CBHHK59/15]|nr:hypothetical protein B0H10DRAFT_1319252 [Mycena sp. CBHHK59/15]